MHKICYSAGSGTRSLQDLYTFWIFCSPRFTPRIIHHNFSRLQNMLKRSSRPRRKRPALSWAHTYTKTKHLRFRFGALFLYSGPTRTRTSNCGFGDRRFTIETIGPYVFVFILKDKPSKSY